MEGISAVASATSGASGADPIAQKLDKISGIEQAAKDFLADLVRVARDIERKGRGAAVIAKGRDA